jgi:hypothetical protein
VNERVFTLLCAIGALALFTGMFLRRDGGIDPRREISRPTTVEHRANGYRAVSAWLEGEQIRVVSLRDRFDELLSQADLAPAGNLLVVTLPGSTAFTTEEFVALDRWVRAGNSLLVLAALSDMPDWAFRSAGVPLGDLNLLTGLEFETARGRDFRLRNGDSASTEALENAAEPDVSQLRAFVEPQRATLQPNRPHAYFEGVDSAVALSDFSAFPWTVKVPYQGFVLALARQRETGEGVLWARPLGAGRIIVSGFGSLLTNRAIGLPGNARLVANIVAANVAEQGAVIFDDAHQGLGAAYDPRKFFSDGRLYATVGVLLAVWLIWVLGSTRLRVPVARNLAPNEVELVHAAGGFFARVLPAHVAARRLLEHFFRRANARLRRPDAGPPWELLERHPRVARADLEQLRRWHADAGASRRVPLGRLYNLILRLDGNIA